ncbi:flavodoxin [Clostridium sp. FP1]|uniref:flavodoxin n=1 Tax=Clostridium sp. FP1 TaxID=2724076 RepID=UPI0013E93717|nr:flavodoxin [Clostridium sp. FP1]MBZ9633156.1 flavodoxin [Clostridium sp. FP1]
MDENWLKIHEKDILILKMQNRGLLNQIKRNKKEIEILREYNRQILGRENNDSTKN